MRGTVIGAGMTLLFVGCSGPRSNDHAIAANSANAPARALDDTQRRIAAMPETERNAVLIRSIRDARQDCQHVDSSQPLNNPAGQPSYLATCDRTKHFAVTIGPSGAGAVTAPAAQGR